MDPSRRSLWVLMFAFACDPGPRVAVEVPTAAGFLSMAKGEAGKAKKQAKVKAARQARLAKDPPAKQAKAARHPAGKSKPRAATPTSEGPPLPACPPDNALSYRSFGDGFLRTWCTGCHSSTLAEKDRQGAPLEVNFDAPALYRPFARGVYDRAVLEAHALAVDPAAAASPMPPAGVVPEADRKRLAQWIACGSPGA